MGKDKSEKRDKKEKKEKRSDDGVKKSKKDKKSKLSEENLAAVYAEAVKEDTPAAKESKLVVVTDEEAILVPVGALVPFANPLADEKVAKKVLKSVKKGSSPFRHDPIIRENTAGG